MSKHIVRATTAAALSTFWLVSLVSAQSIAPAPPSPTPMPRPAAGTPPVATPATYPIDIEKWAGRNRNKRIALEYLQMVNDGKRSDAVRKYAAPTFVNHRSPQSPAMQREANAKAMSSGTQAVPPSSSTPGTVLKAQIGQVVADGDYVMIHYVVTNNADLGRKISNASGAEGGAKVGTNVVDMFKIQKGKIVEKWDAIEAIDRMDIFE